MSDSTTAITMLQVFATEQTAVAGAINVVCSARATKGKTIAADQRTRCIQVPEASMLIDSAAVPSKFLALIQNEVHALAKARLDAAWADGDQRQVPAAHYTVDGLLSYYAEKRQAMNVDATKVLAWLKASATLAALPESKHAAWLSALPKLASPGYRAVLRPDAAAKILAQLAEDDQLSPVGAFVAQRLASIMDAESNADAF